MKCNFMNLFPEVFTLCNLLFMHVFTCRDLQTVVDDVSDDDELRATVISYQLNTKIYVYLLHIHISEILRYLCRYVLEQESTEQFLVHRTFGTHTSALSQ